MSASLFTAVHALRSKSSYFQTPETESLHDGEAEGSGTDDVAPGSDGVAITVTAMTPQDLLVSTQTQADQLKHAAFYTALANATCAPFALRFACSIDDAVWTVSAVSRSYNNDI